MTELSDDTSFAEQTALTKLLGNHPRVKILVVLLSEGQDVTITHIAEQAGIRRSTVYDHIGILEELNVIKNTRKVGRSRMYQINRDSESAKNLAQLESNLIEEEMEKLE